MKRLKKAYARPEAGEWVQPVRCGYRMACCDCGLVHTMNFRLHPTKRGKFIQFQVYRNNRATAAMRRPMQKRAKPAIDAAIKEFENDRR